MKNKSYKTIILSGPVGTGKSSALMEWVKSNNACGFITPTVENKKMLYDISSASYYDYEIDEGNEDTTSIGKYFLSRKAFEISDKIIDAAIKSYCKCFVLDEVGKLELNEQGHYKGLLKLLQSYKETLILVVREQLVEEVILKFQLKDCIILKREEMINYQL